MRLLGVYSLRCRDCGDYFTRNVWLLPSFWCAKCPRCYRFDLGAWDERYYYPPESKRLLLNLGANAYRCESCRYNFVSFLPRKLSPDSPRRRVRSSMPAA